MTIHALQCPKCGAPLPAEPGRDRLYCNHCGAQLTITTGSSGYPMASLADIKADTSVLVLEATLVRFQNELREHRTNGQRLAAARENLLAKKTRLKGKQETRRTFYGIVTVGFVLLALFIVPFLWTAHDRGIVTTTYFVVGTASMCLPTLFLGLLTVTAFFSGSPSGNRALDQQLMQNATDLQRTEAEILRLERQIDLSRHQLDSTDKNRCGGAAISSPGCNTAEGAHGT